MKKKRIAKILAGVAVAALCVTGAVNYWVFHAADIVGTAEIGTYTAGVNEKEWEAANDSLTGAGEAIKRAAKDAAAEKATAAESAEETETAQTEQTAQKPKPATQKTQNTQQAAQTAQGTQTAQPTESEPAPTPTPEPAAPTPAKQICGYCNAVFYSESEVATHIYTVHVTPAQQHEPAPAPAPAPSQPQTVKVPGYSCSCGAVFPASELEAHLDLADEMGWDCHYGSCLVEVPA